MVGRLGIQGFQADSRLEISRAAAERAAGGNPGVFDRLNAAMPQGDHA
jgi:hypothetical protein